MVVEGLVCVGDEFGGVWLVYVGKSGVVGVVECK